MGLEIDSDKVQTVFEVQDGGPKSFSHVLSHGLVRPFQMFRTESIIQILVRSHSALSLTARTPSHTAPPSHAAPASL